MKTIDNYNFKGKKVLIRVDFNVPFNKAFDITDDTRMRAAVPTLKKIISEGGSPIIMSHLGRPTNGPEDKFSMVHIKAHLEELLGIKVKFAKDCIGEETKRMASELVDGDVLLLENLRFHAEEQGKPMGLAKDASETDIVAAKKAVKESQKTFVAELASLGDVWVNDAFGTSHRAHASTALIAKYFPNDKLFGYIVEDELKSVERVLKNPERPFTAIMGGSKVSTKIDIILNMLDKVDNLILGGGMTYTFKKALGGHVGSSICEVDKLDLALEILKKAKDNNVNLLISDETLIADDFSNDANTKICDPMNIPDGWEGLDIGPKTIKEFSKVIENSKTILWNGPVGVFEMPKFAVGTRAIADAIVRATEKGAFSLIGGGDSVAAINQFGLADKVSYVSTGGGALLEYIEGKELPGLAAVLKK